MKSELDPRDRVNLALAHRTPDRLPVDFLAVPEIWDLLAQRFDIASAQLNDSQFFDPAWEEILRRFEVDCRVISYDQFCAPPESAFARGGRTEWWKVQSRSTPARMWRWAGEDGIATEIFGRRFKVQANDLGSYEENIPALGAAESLADVQAHRWPDPDWWDFRPVKSVILEMNRTRAHHIRFRMGAVFELAWQLRGMENFLTEMAAEPAIPIYMMERITDIIAEVTRRLLREAGDDIDMVYFYDDVGSNLSLLISKKMWRTLIRPCHEKLIAVAKQHNKQVMYHTDGAVRPLIPDLIEMGVDVLNPIQPSTAGMEAAGLKRDFGARLSFHGGVDIVGLLPKGSPADVRQAAGQLVRDLGQNGGYIMAGSHHIQCDTPLENVIALYELSNRQLPTQVRAETED
jgi:uroporphyrinogen decarboxylase